MNSDDKSNKIGRVDRTTWPERARLARRCPDRPGSNRGEVEPAFLSRNVGDIGKSNRIQHLDLKIAVEHVRSDAEGMAAVGGQWHPAFASRWINSVEFHLN